MNHNVIKESEGLSGNGLRKFLAPRIEMPLVVVNIADFKNSLRLIALVEQPNGHSLKGRVIPEIYPKLLDDNQIEPLKPKTQKTK